ncbi:MAG: hypothetical protein ACLSDQ_02205 [Adlercreutzia equolifaciens]
MTRTMGAFGSFELLGHQLLALVEDSVRHRFHHDNIGQTINDPTCATAGHRHDGYEPGLGAAGSKCGTTGRPGRRRDSSSLIPCTADGGHLGCRWIPIRPATDAFLLVATPC